MQLKYLILLILFFSRYSPSKGQLSEQNVTKHTADNSWISFNVDQPIKTAQLLTKYRATLGLKPAEQLNYLESQADPLGIWHHRYQETYEGIPIEAAFYTFHEKGGSLSHATGKLAHPKQPNTLASLTEAQALAYALQYLNYEQYAWDIPENEYQLQALKGPEASFFPKGKLLLASTDKGYRLAYTFEINSLQPYKRIDIFVDACTGEFIKMYDKLHTLDVQATGMTSFYGPKNFTCKHKQNIYSLEEEMGRKIKTLDATDFRWYTFWVRPIPFLHSSEDWGSSDPSAIDVHWGVEKWYDYFSSTFGWESYDGKGTPIKSYVHFGKNNSSWNGHSLTFGDGINGDNSWTPIDIVAHELSHGLIENTANLRYWRESGALNEAYADIFGTVIEHHALGTNDWIIGKEINGLGIRSMSDPGLFDHPQEYLDSNWHYGYNDNGGVHTNSGVPNHCFYLLVTGEGALGGNGVGIDSAAQIFFRALRYYLSPSSNFIDARNATVQAARDLYGEGSYVENAVCQAWAAVNVGQTSGCDLNDFITLTAPVTGDSLSMGNNEHITWVSSENFADVVLHASYDNGATWHLLTMPNTPNDGSFIWEVTTSASDQAKLRIKNADNDAIADTTQTFSIIDCPVVANFDGENYVCKDSPYQYMSTSVNATSQTWYLDGQVIGTTPNITLTFDNTGNYELMFMASDDNCTSKFRQTIVVEDAVDIADFTFTTNNLIATFTPIYEDPYAVYYWDFGNGSTSNLPNVTYTYSSEGNYQVSLAVQNACTSITQTQLVTIEEGRLDLPQYASLCSDVPSILNAGDYPYQSYEWSFDNQIVGDQPTLTVTQEGVYTLNVVDFNTEQYTDDISVRLDFDCVWPGDVNMDGLVNNYDLLFFGLAAGSEGPLRQGANSGFTGQAANIFTGDFRHGANFKHADMNGDGMVNELDANVILQNYGEDRELPLPTVPTPMIPTSIILETVIDYIDPFSGDASLSLSVYNADGSPVSFYGLAFTVLHEGNLDTYLPDLVLDTTILGANVLGLIKNAADGTDIAFTATDHKNIQFQSQQATRSPVLQVIIHDILETGDPTQDYTILLDDVLLINNLGDTLLSSVEPLVIAFNYGLHQVVATPSNCTAYGTASVVGNNDMLTTYQWSTGQTGSSITGLPPGIYDLTITDQYGSLTVVDFEITGVFPFEIAVDQSGNSATATLVSEGSGFYAYTWSHGATGLSTSNIPGGNHILTVRDDSLGCIDYVGFFVPLQITGGVYDSKGNPIAGVDFSLSGDTSITYSTPADGTFSYTNLGTGNFTLSPSKSNSLAAEGLSISDLILIRRHLLGQDTLTGQSLIAADVNMDCKVSISDFILIKRLLQGELTSFSTGAPWRFLPQNYVFPTGDFPCNFAESIEFSPLSRDALEQYFIGIKRGDVNSSGN